jgi:hypothetical protein
VWNHSLPAAAPTVREPSARPAEPRRWTLREEAERRVEEYRSRPHDAAWTRDPGWTKDRWPVADREWSEERGREESLKSEDRKKV